MPVIPAWGVAGVEVAWMEEEGGTQGGRVSWHAYVLQGGSYDFLEQAAISA